MMPHFLVFFSFFTQVVGPFANITDQLFGDYSSNILPQYTSTVYQGLSNLADTTALGVGCSEPTCTSYNRSDVEAAVTGSDLVVVCLGTGQSIEQESRDRSSIDLPGYQLQLLQEATKYGKPWSCRSDAGAIQICNVNKAWHHFLFMT